MTTSAAQSPEVCAVCGQAAEDGRKLRCGACRTQPYCGRACARKDWPRHKLSCSGARNRPPQTSRARNSAPSANPRPTAPPPGPGLQELTIVFDTLLREASAPTGGHPAPPPPPTEATVALLAPDVQQLLRLLAAAQLPPPSSVEPVACRIFDTLRDLGINRFGVPDRLAPIVNSQLLVFGSIDRRDTDWSAVPVMETAAIAACRLLEGGFFELAAAAFRAVCERFDDADPDTPERLYDLGHHIWKRYKRTIEIFDSDMKGGAHQGWASGLSLNVVICVGDRADTDPPAEFFDVIVTALQRALRLHAGGGGGSLCEPDLQMSEEILPLALMKVGRDDEALALRRATVRRRSAAADPTDPYVLLARFELSQLLAGMARFEEAAESCLALFQRADALLSMHTLAHDRAVHTACRVLERLGRLHEEPGLCRAFASAAGSAKLREVVAWGADDDALLARCMLAYAGDQEVGAHRPREADVAAAALDATYPGE